MKADLTMLKGPLGENLTLLFVGLGIIVFTVLIFYVRLPDSVVLFGFPIQVPMFALLALMALAGSIVELFRVALGKHPVTLANALNPILPAAWALAELNNRLFESLSIAAIVISGVTAATLLARRIQAKVSK
jgi:hypothetical protein